MGSERGQKTGAASPHNREDAAPNTSSEIIGRGPGEVGSMVWSARSSGTCHLGLCSASCKLERNIERGVVRGGLERKPAMGHATQLLRTITRRSFVDITATTSVGRVASRRYDIRVIADACY